MKIYQGFRKGASAFVYVDTEELKVDRSYKLREYAPEFEWGYRGAGPTQLALALLLDCFDNEQLAIKYHLFFRDEVVVHLEFDNWVLLDKQIQHWLETKLNEYDEIDRFLNDEFDEW